MTEPRRIGELLEETLAAIRAAGPVLTKLDLSPQLYSALAREHFAAQAVALNLYGETTWGPWLGVPAIVDRTLPPYARREHYSDGRVVTRYRLVMDPRARQVAVSAATESVPYGRGRRLEHTLSLQDRRGFGWLHAMDPETGGSYSWEWIGPRVCQYLPGLERIAELAGLKLTDWQRDYLGATLRGHHASPIQLNVPRIFGRGLT